MHRIILTLVCILSFSTAYADADFDMWLNDLRKDAIADGISSETLDAALTDVALIPRVIELDRSQPEFTLTFAQYLERVVPVSRQKRAQARREEHRAMLDEIGAKYGVQPRFIVALWGIETDFGRVQGGFKVIPALVTLAYDGRRSKFFRKELMDALHIIEDGHISAANMNGSWAGAMGQSQFMPSSFRQYAQDYNNDGKKDIWDTQSDVFASAANYLSSVGWRSDMTWGRLVSLPSDGIASPSKAMALHDNKTKKLLPEWSKLGIKSADGSALPTRPLKARLVMPDGADGPAYLVYANYEAILRWNRSNYFAIAVGTLADSMR
ncbi:lytic murein transglycosylase [Alphaproteobacteria bacterium]|nr:lytic murein transglycosylase [Alphaproteobacteria bacterium]